MDRSELFPVWPPPMCQNFCIILFQFPSKAIWWRPSEILCNINYLSWMSGFCSKMTRYKFYLNIQHHIPQIQLRSLAWLGDKLEMMNDLQFNASIGMSSHKLSVAGHLCFFVRKTCNLILACEINIDLHKLSHEISMRFRISNFTQSVLGIKIGDISGSKQEATKFYLLTQKLQTGCHYREVKIVLEFPTISH